MDADYGNAGDEALVQACLAGEPAAMEALVVRYTRATFAVALSRLGSRQDAEDVAQETFVTAIQTLHTLKDPPRVGAWLCAIARHKALNWSARWRRPGTVSWEALPAGARPVEGLPGAADAIAAAELRSTVRSAISGLTPPQREAVVLCAARPDVTPACSTRSCSRTSHQRAVGPAAASSHGPGPAKDG